MNLICYTQNFRVCGQIKKVPFTHGNQWKGFSIEVEMAVFSSYSIKILFCRTQRAFHNKTLCFTIKQKKDCGRTMAEKV